MQHRGIYIGVFASAALGIPALIVAFVGAEVLEVGDPWFVAMVAASIGSAGTFLALLAVDVGKWLGAKRYRPRISAVGTRQWDTPDSRLGDQANIWLADFLAQPIPGHEREPIRSVRGQITFHPSAGQKRSSFSIDNPCWVRRGDGSPGPLLEIGREVDMKSDGTVYHLCVAYKRTASANCYGHVLGQPTIHVHRLGSGIHHVSVRLIGDGVDQTANFLLRNFGSGGVLDLSQVEVG